MSTRWYSVRCSAAPGSGGNSSTRSAATPRSPKRAKNNARVEAPANDIPFSIRRAWGNRESNFAQASKVAVDTLAGLLNDPKVTVPVFRQGGDVGSGPSFNAR